MYTDGLVEFGKTGKIWSFVRIFPTYKLGQISDKISENFTKLCENLPTYARYSMFITIHHNFYCIFRNNLL
jgi:hypothetical protein